MKPFTLHEAIMYGKGTERPFLCPVHGDTRPSASVNMIKKKWICYTCGARGGLTGEAACIEPDYEVMKLWLEQKLEEKRVYPESWLNQYDAGPVHPYWLERVGEAAARYFRLGADPDRNAVTYPLRDTAGRVLGVVRRGLLHGDGPKYRYPTSVDVGRLLFNYSPDARRAVVLVEGALDAVAFHNVGVQAFAIYGARLSAAQVALVDRVDPDVVVTAFDNDDAGFGAHVEVTRNFRHRIVDRLRWPASWGKDVDEIGPERLTTVVSRLDSTDLGCIESESWKTSSPQTTPRSSRSTSRPKRMRIVPSHA